MYILYIKQTINVYIYMVFYKQTPYIHNKTICTVKLTNSNNDLNSKTSDSTDISKPWDKDNQNSKM